MKGRVCFFGLACVLMLTSPLAVAARQFEDPSAGIRLMRCKNGSVSIETTDAPLKRVLEAFSDLAEVDVVSDGPIKGSVTVYIRDLAPDVAARKILRGKNVSFLYRRQGPESRDSGYRLVEIRIYLSGENGPGEKISPTPITPEPAPDVTLPNTPSGDAANSGVPARPGPASDAAEPEILSGKGAERLYLDIAQGNWEAAEEGLAALIEALPDEGERIDRFVEAMEYSRIEAEREGIPIPEELEVPSMRLLLGLEEPAGGPASQPK